MIKIKELQQMQFHRSFVSLSLLHLGLKNQTTNKKRHTRFPTFCKKATQNGSTII